MILSRRRVKKKTQKTKNKEKEKEVQKDKDKTKLSLEKEKGKRNKKCWKFISKKWLLGNWGGKLLIDESGSMLDFADSFIRL